MPIGIVDEHRKLLYVTAIIDADHFRGTWHGQIFEVRALPGTGSLSVGDVIMAHVLPGNSELVAIFPQQEIIYFSPGGLWPGAWANWKGELWKYDGVNPPTHVWTPNFLTMEHPTCLAWYAATQRLYIWTYGSHPISGDVYHRIYKLNPADDSVTLVLEHDQDTDGDWSDGRFNNPAMDVAEFPLDGCLYVHFGWEYPDPWEGIICFDPMTEVERFVYEYPGAGALAAFAGGICYHPGTGKLLFFSGYQMYESVNGVNVVLNQDLEADFDLFDSGPMVLNPTDGKVYLATEFLNPGGTGGILVYDGVNWAIDYQYAGSGGGNVGFKGLGNLYSLAGVAETVAGYWAWWWVTDRAAVHKKTGGVWGLDWAGPPVNEGWVHSSCQTMISLRGELCVLVFDRQNFDPLGWYGTRFYKRDALGAYIIIMNWATYQCWATHAYTMCMSPVRTARKCHEL